MIAARRDRTYRLLFQWLTWT